MNRKEYMEQLAYLLQDVPDQEKEEAMQYYEDYFEEAGTDREKEVMKELGSPEKVAAIIKAGIAGNFGEAGEYTECGYEDERFREEKKVPDVFAGCARWEADGEENSNGTGKYDGKEQRKKVNIKKEKTEKKAETKKTEDIFQGDPFFEKEKRQKREKTNTTKRILLLILVAIFLIPVGIPLLAGVAGVMIGIAAVIFALILVGIVLIFVLAILGIVFIGVGIAKAFVSLPVGLLCSGIGCLMTALGILFAWLCIGAAVKVVPWIIRKFVDLCSIPFQRGRYGR
ncbi:MAG: DUF1700 domain-containing protein [Lachnospiraceae bacterium]|nr:DUF1700 domain-containing protein [Robinsoniella sp.]MDY3767291.1 DUF1700 domain-containing protein [Lachnospiraceae bacterium]